MDNCLRPVRGARAVILVSKTADAATVLAAAIDKFAAHDRNFPTSNTWILHYPDGTPVQRLLEGKEDFRLDAYKEEVMREYSRITLFISAAG